MKSLGLLLTCLTLVNAPISFSNNLDPIYDELLQDSNFAPHEYLINKNVKNHEEFEGLLLHEHISSDLIFYVFNVTGFEILNPNDCRISLAYNSENYNHYSLEYLGNTKDEKFYKFKINDLKLNSEDSKREYKIAEFELKQERVYLDGNAVAVKETEIYISSSISQSYTYTDDGYTVNDISTISLDVNVGYKRTFGTTSGDVTWNYWTDINYLYFNAPNYLGDLIGVKVDFYKTTKVENYKTKTQVYTPLVGATDDELTLDDGNKVSKDNLYNLCYCDSVEYKDGNNDKYYSIDFTSEDKSSIVGSSHFEALITNILNFSWKWGHEDIKDIKIIEKINYSELISGKTNYYLSDEDFEYLSEKPFDQVFEDTWLIRFDFSKFGLKGRNDHIVADKGSWNNTYSFQYTGSNIIDYSVEKSSYRDVDVITLTYSKDGKAYTLPVVSNTNNLTHGNETPSPLMPDWLKTLLKILAIILGLILLIPILPYLIQLIVWIIKFPFMLIKWIINLFKKDNKKKK